MNLIFAVFCGLISYNVKCFDLEDRANIRPVNNGDLLNYSILNNKSDFVNPQKRNVISPVIQLPPPTNATTGEKPSVKKELKSIADVPKTSTEAGSDKLVTSNKITSNKTSTAVSQQTSTTISSLNTTLSSNATNASTPTVVVTKNVTSTTTSANNVTLSTTEKADSSDGAKKRGLLVFGSLGLFSAAYLTYKIYKRRKQQRNNDLSFYPNNNEQFKYGVLMSNDHDDNLELSNIPQTIDSDDEEVEIFDLENKKFLDNEGYKEMHHNHRSVGKDVDILDLNVPRAGNSDETPPRSTADDNLLQFEDSQQTSEAAMLNSQTKRRNPDDFFDIL